MQRYLVFLATFAFAASPAFAKPVESVVYPFGQTSTDFIGPQEGVIADTKNNLYGTARDGGAQNDGTVFMVAPNGVETVLHSFAGGAGDGQNPYGALAMDKKGDLFGTTQSGGSGRNGVVFELVPNGGSYTEKVIYSFCSLSNCADGSQPMAGVVIGEEGVLYGTTRLGGTGVDGNLGGTVWRLAPPPKHETVWKETVLYNFCSQPNCTDGRQPYTRLLLKDDMLYGVTLLGQSDGTLYRVSTNGSPSSFKTLHTFGSGTDGAAPASELSADKGGVLYGTTRAGGTHGCGTAYSLDPANSAIPVYTQLYNFCDQASDGTGPNAGLTVSQAKGPPTLYGAAAAGGIHGRGTLYVLVPPKHMGDRWTETTPYSFCSQPGCTDGAAPGYGAPLKIGKVLYGTTTAGGGANDGVLYRFGKP